MDSHQPAGQQEGSVGEISAPLDLIARNDAPEKIVFDLSIATDGVFARMQNSRMPSGSATRE
jgi:hypothetical protein